MSFATLADIAIKALQLQEAMDARRAADDILRSAYHRYKIANGTEYVDRDSPAMQLIKDATALPFARVKAAKALERAAKQRLERACRRAQAEMAAGPDVLGVLHQLKGAA